MHNSQACIHIHFTRLMAPLIRVLATDLTQLELQGSDPPWCIATAAWARLSKLVDPHQLNLWKRNECVNFKIWRKHAKSWVLRVSTWKLTILYYPFIFYKWQILHPFFGSKHRKCPVSALNIGLGSGMLVEDEVVFSGWIGVPLRMRILGSARRFMVLIFLSIWFPQP